MEPLSLTRRSLLAGASGLLAGLPRAREARARPADRALLVVWLAGGPSQLETWDPHPGGAAGGPTRALTTRVPGLAIAHGYPRLAERIHHLSVVRSLVSAETEHARATYQVKTGHRPEAAVRHPSLTALFAARRPGSPALPAHVSLLPSPWPAWGGELGAGLDAFRVPEPARGIAHLEPAPRLERRLELRGVVDHGFAARRPPVARAAPDLEDRTRALLSSTELDAFRLNEEPGAVRQAYGATPFGEACLAARRLLERGARAIEVNLDGFDTHTDAFTEHARLATILDPALSALLDDLHQRELLARTTLLCLGEMGRTPRINALDGRDHWTHGFSALIGGAGLRAGQVVGATDPAGLADPVDPLPIADLAATTLAALGLEPADTFHTQSGRPVRLSAGRALARLLA